MVQTLKWNLNSSVSTLVRCEAFAFVLEFYLSNRKACAAEHVERRCVHGTSGIDTHTERLPFLAQLVEQVAC